MIAEEVKNCRLCGGKTLAIILDLGNQALSGYFPDPTDSEIPIAPLQLAKCPSCGLVQIRHRVDPATLYHKGYGYRSGINATMRNHLAAVSREAEMFVKLKKNDIVLDIASNDGTLLHNYSVQGIRRVGVDPLIQQFEKYYDKDILKICDFFPTNKFKEIFSEQKAKIITSIAVFYDLDDPQFFVKGIAEILADDGVWILEQSDIGLMLDAKSFDTICHEHLEYYALRQLKILIVAQGLRIINVTYNDSNGGSIRLYIGHQDGPYPINQAALEKAEQNEKERRLDDFDTFACFRVAMEKMRDQITEFIRSEKTKGKIFHLYGASTKGNVLLQYCGIDASLIDAAAERNPDKWGKQTPGTKIPIISEEESRNCNVDYYLVLPWHFRNEFIEREKKFIAQGGKLIFPLPQFEVYPAP